MDKDKVKIILKEAINKAFDKNELEDRGTYLGEETINLMTESALNVLWATHEVQIYMSREGLLK